MAKIYKNPWVTRECYFFPTVGHIKSKNEPEKVKGYNVEYLNGKWEIRTGMMYEKTLAEMTIVGEIKPKFLKDAVIRLILSAVKYKREANAGK